MLRDPDQVDSVTLGDESISDHIPLLRYRLGTESCPKRYLNVQNGHVTLNQVLRAISRRLV
jgi:hypothetical protein